MFMTDTSVWIDWTKGVDTPKTSHLATRLSEVGHVLADIVLYEILQGVRDERRMASLRDLLLLIPVVQIGGAALAVKAASNYRSLRAVGFTTSSSIDCLIATYCIETGTALLHNDRDFNPFEDHLGLRVVREGDENLS